MNSVMAEGLWATFWSISAGGTVLQLRSARDSGKVRAGLLIAALGWTGLAVQGAMAGHWGMVGVDSMVAALHLFQWWKRRPPRRRRPVRKLLGDKSRALRAALVRNLAPPRPQPSMN
jgi:hypothetical protein